MISPSDPDACECAGMHAYLCVLMRLQNDSTRTQSSYLDFRRPSVAVGFHELRVLPRCMASGRVYVTIAQLHMAVFCVIDEWGWHGR
jgi:hypothetical protein